MLRSVPFDWNKWKVQVEALVAAYDGPDAAAIRAALANEHVVGRIFHVQGF
jgi:hypothetical protein